MEFTEDAADPSSSALEILLFSNTEDTDILPRLHSTGASPPAQQRPPDDRGHGHRGPRRPRGYSVINRPGQGHHGDRSGCRQNPDRRCRQRRTRECSSSPSNPTPTPPFHNEEFANGAAFAAERARAEARLQRPLFRHADQGRIPLRLRLPVGAPCTRVSISRPGRTPIYGVDGVVIDLPPQRATGRGKNCATPTER